MKIDFTWRIWLLIVILLLSLLSIFGSPTKIFQEGVLVTSVESNSTASNEGLQKGQIIEFVDGKKVTSLEDYLLIMNQKFPSENNLKTVINTKDSEIIFFTNDFPEITVSEIPKTNLVTGLDISGGSRALVKPQDVSLSSEETNGSVICSCKPKVTSASFKVFSNLYTFGVISLGGAEAISCEGIL